MDAAARRHVLRRLAGASSVASFRRPRSGKTRVHGSVAAARSGSDSGRDRPELSDPPTGLVGLVTKEKMMSDTKGARTIVGVVVMAASVIAAAGLKARATTGVQTSRPADTVTKEQRLKWFREAKYGLFIHWGLYAIPAGEWNGRAPPGLGERIMSRTPVPVKQYEQLAARFNPVKFNADEWVQLAQDAGMKYIVITSKHHD